MFKVFICGDLCVDWVVGIFYVRFMMICFIIIILDLVFWEICLLIEMVDDSVCVLVDDMLEIMYDVFGIGLVVS